MKLVYKFLLTICFAGLTLLAIRLHSDHQTSFFGAMIFISGKYHLTERLPVIELLNLNCSAVFILLIAIVKQKRPVLIICCFMILYLLLLFPFKYVADPTMSF